MKTPYLGVHQTGSSSMSPRYAVPAFYVDEVKLIDGTPGGRALIELDSLGTPIRLSLSAHDIMKLGRWATKVGGELISTQNANIVEFPKPQRKRKTKA